MSLIASFLTDARKHVQGCAYKDARVYFTSALGEVNRCENADDAFKEGRVHPHTSNLSESQDSAQHFVVVAALREPRELLSTS
jgi:hypothetical protein